MRYPSLSSFLAAAKLGTSKGPVAVIVAEDEVELTSTIRHHSDAGFAPLILLAPPALYLEPVVESLVQRVDYAVFDDAALENAINAVIESVPGSWIYYCYNGEYLFYPFCETRNIRDMLAFHTEERRDAILSYVIDLYARDINQFPDAVSLETAHLDRSGYYALGRGDPANNWHPKERQLDFFGGLRWRFEEHVSPPRRKIDRIALFRAKPGLKLRSDYTFNDEEYNTYACPWHHNITTAIVSFRTAKGLRSNPGSRFAIKTFHWHNSVPFEWHSQQLMDFGLMEPGQWY
ncbi:MAG: hypothetical protein ACEQSU_08945 [Microgenomates group bacterium]